MAFGADICFCLFYNNMGWTYSSTSSWRVGILCLVGVLGLWGTTQSGFEERGRGTATETKKNNLRDVNKSTTSSLTTFYERRILPLMLYPDQEEYTVPGDVILDDFQTIVTQMMHLRHNDDEKDLSMECTAMDLRSLTDMYQLLYFHDTVVQQSYCILMTVSRHFPWGTVIVRPPSPSTIDTDNHSTTTKTTTPTTFTTYHFLSIDCPHPLHDRGTAEMSIAIFQGTNAARSLVLAGAHRHAAIRRNHNNHSTHQ